MAIVFKVDIFSCPTLKCSIFSTRSVVNSPTSSLTDSVKKLFCKFQIRCLCTFSFRLFNFFISLIFFALNQAFSLNCRLWTCLNGSWQSNWWLDKLNTDKRCTFNCSIGITRLKIISPIKLSSWKIQPSLTWRGYRVINPAKQMLRIIINFFVVPSHSGRVTFQSCILFVFGFLDFVHF